MKAPKRIKLYTHHFLSLQVPVAGQVAPRDSFFVRIGKWVFNICFWMGSAILFVFRMLGQLVYLPSFFVGSLLSRGVHTTFHAAKKDIRTTSELFSKRYQLLVSRRFSQSIVAFVGLCLVGWGFFVGAHVIAYGLELKNTVVARALLGSKNLTDAQEALTHQDFTTANDKFTLALNNFKDSKQEVDTTGAFISQLLDVFPQKRDGEQLLEAGTIISQTGQEIVTIKHNLDKLKLSPTGVSSDGSPSEILRSVDDSLKVIVSNMNRVTALVANINASSIPANQREKFILLKDQVGFLTTTLENVRNIYQLLYGIVNGDKNILIFFENNNELRATGGFLGTYGNFKLHDGTIQTTHISSIYDLDGQLKEKILPPTPLLSVNDNWYLRDSNWFADFPESAQKMASFYEKEGGETPDIVIVLTPRIITDLLQLTGPVHMTAYNTTFDADNFVEQTQVLSSVTNNSPLNNPKQVLADFFAIFLQKILSAPPEQYPALLDKLQSNLNGKQLLLYARDPALEEQFKDYNWSGDIKSTDRDYMSVVSSNLGGTKTDLNITQSINVITDIGADGGIVNEVTITRANALPAMEGTENKSFVRILVPHGAQLISNTGFDYVPLDTKELKDHKIDPDVLTWEKTSVRDIVTGTLIGTEAGKTFFGNWMNVPGSSSKTITIRYKLPFALARVDRYSMLLQKQPGTVGVTYLQTIRFSGRALEWKNFTQSTLENSLVAVSVPLDRDYLFGAIFSKR